MSDPKTIVNAFEAGHFYSPIVDPAQLIARRAAIWATRDSLPGIDFNDLSHRHFLEDAFPRYIRDFDYPAVLEDGPELNRYYIDNSQFGWLDARLLFVLMRELRPRRITEIGSGYSSLLMADVNRRFLGNAVEITCIEPYPRPFLRNGIEGIHRLIEEPVQSVAPEEFASLQSGDILFVDSSHVAKTGSDVNFIVFELLPALAPGVLVHFHDIFFPNEYPEEWVLDENRSWNEQYVIRALLMYTTAFEIVFGSSIASERHTEQLRKALAMPDNGILSGCSLWIRKLRPGGRSP